METIRQRIIACLSEVSMNAIDISQDLGIMEKEVYEHLPHIARSVASQGKSLVIHPSMCLKCGFVFENRKRFTRPGRCPQCRETRIRRPAYEIR
ncbi:MAG: transcriptional regulator [Deltaproteobacteria bacterium]|nr:transcriptional regulator [Deltaproteobacteria bacterium]MBW2144679.1 transcriptional regulator [Deltaproteobacteria bacterium]